MATDSPIVSDYETARELHLMEQETPTEFVTRLAEYAVNWIKERRDGIDRDRLLAAYKDRLTSLLLSQPCT